MRANAPPPGGCCRGAPEKLNPIIHDMKSIANLSRVLLALFCFPLVGGCLLAANASAAAETKAAVPRLVDLGADKCIPCKMMAPILAGLEKEYAGQFDVVFIDVWKNAEQGKR
jgi:thioredoxin 1